jgi:hypothetical protein
MYSPKVNESLIPQIYRAAKTEKIAMTKWVNRVLEEALTKVCTPGPDPQGEASVRGSNGKGEKGVTRK